MLLVRLERSQQVIHDVKEMVCRTKFHALWETINNVEPGQLPYNYQHSFWRRLCPLFSLWRILSARGTG
jgi:hypothetical protein